MADVASASTYVAAVLETAGYLTQARLISEFQTFIQHFGILLFVLASLGALVSIALYGSYKFGALLLIGPIFFTAFICTTANTKGSIWRIGAGPPRKEVGQASNQQEAVKSVRDTLAVYQETPKAVEDVYREDIPISMFFKIYSGVVDSLVKNLVDLILPLQDTGREDVRNLLFISKTYALDSLISMKMDKDTLIGMFHSDFLYQCRQMSDASLALGSPDLSTRRAKQLSDSILQVNHPETRQIYQRSLKDLEDRVAKATIEREAGSKKLIQVGAQTRKFMITNQDVAGSATANWLSSTYPGQRMENITDPIMTCGDIWLVVRDAVWEAARSNVKNLINDFGQQAAPADRGLLCVELAKKIGKPLADSEKDNCENTALVEIAGVLMIRNAISELGYSKAIRSARDDMQFIATEKKGKVTLLDSDRNNWELVNGPENYNSKIKNLQSGSTREYVEVRHKTTGQIEWKPYITLEADVYGDVDAGFVRHQQYATREIRQQLFSLVLNFPYYQGLLLYLIAMAFPFVAILLVIPGKAGVFLNYLLVWLWVKSWDVGIALVMVLEKVMWNLFPSSDFDNNFVGGVKQGTQSLPEILYQGFRIDPAYNVHAYYFILSTAIMGVPTMLAYATLKLRRTAFQGISDAITQPLFDAAQDAGGKGGGSFGITMMNVQNQALKELSGAALISGANSGTRFSDPVNGIGASGVDAKSAHYWANQLATAKKQAGLELGRKFGDAGYAEQQQALLFEGNRRAAFYRFLQANAMVSAQYGKAFDEELGVFGRYQFMKDAAAAGLDGSKPPAFETNKKNIGGLYSAMMELTWMNTAAEIEIMSVEKIKADAPRAFQLSTTNATGKLRMTYEYSDAAAEAMNAWDVMSRGGKSPYEEFYSKVTVDVNKAQKDEDETQSKIKKLRSEGLSDADIERILQVTLNFVKIPADTPYKPPALNPFARLIKDFPEAESFGGDN